MNDLIWDVRNMQDKIADENLMKILWEITPIYSTSDFYKVSFRKRKPW